MCEDADRDDEAAAGATVPAADIILGSSKALTLTLASLVKEMHCPAIPAGRKNSRHGAHSTVNPSIVFSQVTRKNAQFRGFQQVALVLSLVDNLVVWKGSHREVVGLDLKYASPSTLLRQSRSDANETAGSKELNWPF